MAKRKSSPNGIIDTNIVWDVGGDTYSHVDIKNWIDKFDVAIGALMADREPLGTVKAWSFPDKTVPDGTAPSIPAGWVVAKGQTLTSSQHDFPDFVGVSVVLPDYRGKVLIGADESKSLRAAGTETLNPGIKGVQGANTHDLADHYHDHQHLHRTGGVTGVETLHAVETDPSHSGAEGSGGLGDSQHSSPVSVNTDASGSGYQLTKAAHAHQLAAMFTSGARVFDNANANKRVVDAGNANSDAGDTGTGKQKVSTGGSAASPTGGAEGEDLTASAYQKSEGVYFIMKVKWGSDYTRPWKIRNSAGSVASVGTA